VTETSREPETRFPAVSVVIPTRDRPELLRRAVRAVLDQRYPGRIECVVAFDQCEVRLPDVDAPSDREMLGVENGRTPGLAGTRNSGAIVATGTYLAFCDDDDEWMPDKLRLQVSALMNEPEASAATCGILVVNGTREIPRLPPDRIVRLDDLTRSRRMDVHSSTLVMARERFLGDIGMIDEEIPGSYGEDLDWILRAAAAGPLVAVPQPLVRVHWQTSFFSSRWETIVLAHEYQLKKHPELSRNPRNLSRMYGQIAFAHAALKRRRQARSWANRSIRLDWRQPRGYLAHLVTFGLSPRLVVRALNSVGRGM
jgi:glycosyltransferase involved in cell wall biosynthesis